MPSFNIELEKQQSKHTDVSTIKAQLKRIADRGVSGTRASWTYGEIKGYNSPSTLPTGQVLYKVSIAFRRKKSADSDQLDHEMAEVAKFMQTAGNSLNWKITGKQPSWKVEKTNEKTNGNSNPDSDDFVDFDRALTFDQITIPPVLIHGEDYEIEEYPAFSNIYGRAAHIRTMAEAMQTMLSTQGKRRNHLCLHGLPACGKSSLFHAWQEVLPKGSFIRINANSATKAGLEDLFLSRLHEVGVPPFIFVEEMEKTLETILTTWLSILDERAEVRKIVHGRLRYAEVRSLVFATVNDKVLFDRLMGGRPKSPGALSSRMTPIYVPRPDFTVMRRILRRDIALFYPEAGKNTEKWVERCIELAQAIGTNDPRRVVTFLDGRERLLTGEKQRDIMRLHELEASDRNLPCFDVEESDFESQS